MNIESVTKVNILTRAPWKLIIAALGFIIIIGGIGYQVYDNNKKYDEISNRLTALTSQIDTVKNDVSDVQSYVSDVQSEVSDISYSTDDVKRTIDYYKLAWRHI